MFHWKDNWYFGRKKNGDVMVIKSTQDLGGITDFPIMGGLKAEVQIEIPRHEWASIVASMSCLGETSESYRICDALQGGYDNVD